MNIQERIQRVKDKPFRVTCLHGDYSASFKTSDEAFDAKDRHQSKFPTHKVVVSSTTIIG